MRVFVSSASSRRAMQQLAQLAQRVLRRREVQVLRQLLRDGAGAAREAARAARSTSIDSCICSRSIALVLPERVVFGDEHRALQSSWRCGRTAPTAGRGAAPRPCARASARAQLDERGGRRIRRASGAHVGQRQVDVGQERRTRRRGAGQRDGVTTFFTADILPCLLSRRPPWRRPRPRPARPACPCTAAAPTSIAERNSRRPAIDELCAHQADAPDPPGERPEAGADLHVEARRAGRGAPRPSSTPSGTRTAFSVHSRSASGGSRRGPSPSRPAASTRWWRSCRAQRASSPSSSIASSASCERVHERGGDRVVVLAPHPVVLEQGEVEVEAAALHAPRERRRRERDRRQPGRRAHALLRAAVARRRCPTPPSRAGARRATSRRPRRRARRPRARRPRSPGPGCRTPVDVSAWTTQTMSAPSRRQRVADALRDRRPGPTRRRAA